MRTIARSDVSRSAHQMARPMVRPMARRTLAVATAAMFGGCLGPTDPVRARAADVALTIAAASAPALGDGARTTVVTPASVDVSITAPVGGTVLELLRTSVVPDSAGRRVPVRVELATCLADGRETCNLSVTVRLRAANGAAYDSSSVGPFTVAPGATLEVPAIRFRATSRLQLLDSVLNVPLGRTGSVRVNAFDASSQPLAGRALVWRSLDPTIATVDGNGVVSAVAQGRARIEAAREGLTVTSLVNATPVEGLTLAASAMRVMAGTSVTLTPTITVQSGRSTRVTYASSNAAVATVDTAGRVTTLGPGVVQLSVTAVADTTQRAQVTLTVDPFRAAVSVRSYVTGPRGSFPGNVNDLKGYAADSVFAVGCGDPNSGFLVRFDGTDWRPIAFPGTFCPQAVGRLANGTVVMLSGQSLLRLTNGTWTTEPLPGGAFFFTMAVTGNTIFAGAANGTVLRWDGSWTTMSLGSTGQVTHLSAANDGTVYAATNGNNTAQLFRLSAGVWQEVNTGAAWLSISGLQVFSATEVFVGGANASATFAHAVFNGSTWQQGVLSTLVPSQFRAFAAAGSVRYGITGVGDVFRWTGTGWAFEHPTGMQGARMVGGTNWLVAAGWHGSSWQFSNNVWRRVSHVPSLTALWAASPTFMMAGGNEGSVDMFDGTAWRAILPPGFRYIRSVYGVDSTDVWVAATRMFYRYRQGIWDSIPHTFGDVSAFWGARRDQVWAATNNGAILRFNGTAWLQVDQLPAGILSLTGVSLPNGSVVMYAGGFGQVFRSTGGAWTAEPVGGAVITSVYAADTANVFATSQSTAPLRRVNGQWVAMPPVTTQGFGGGYWIGGTSPTDLYVGGCGPVYHFNGSAWSALPQTGPSSLVCGYFGGASHAVFRTGGFVVGQILRQLLVGVGVQGQTPGIPQ